MLLLLLLSVTAMLSRRWTGSHGRMGSVCWAAFFLFPKAATASTATVASFAKTLTGPSFTLSMGWVVMQGNFDIPIFTSRRGGGRRTRR